MRGKYSPTVTAAYMNNQEWHNNLLAPNDCVYDVDGYDSYGYDKNDVDRAGNNECEYYSDDWVDGEGYGDNFAYCVAVAEWGFDGVRPVILS